MKLLALESGHNIQAEEAELDVEQELTAEEQVAEWRAQLSELRTGHLRDTAYDVDIQLVEEKIDTLLGREDTRKELISEAPAYVKGVYDGMHARAQRALLATEPKLGSRKLTVTERLYGAEELEGTVLKRLPQQTPMEQLLTGVFEDGPRRATMKQASDFSTGKLKNAYNNSLKKTFNPITEKIDEAPPAEELDLEPVMLAERVAEIKGDVDAAISELTTILRSRERHVGSTALGAVMSYEQSHALVEQVMKLNQALNRPDYTSLRSMVSRAYCKTLDLPGMSKLTSDVSILVNRGRSYLRDALLAQADAIVAQRERGLAWQQINVEVPMPWQRPQYMQVIDKRIKAMQDEGIPNDKIHRRLAREYHVDINPQNEAAAKYISGWYAGKAGKNNRDASNDRNIYV